MFVTVVSEVAFWENSDFSITAEGIFFLHVWSVHCFSKWSIRVLCKSLLQYFAFMKDVFFVSILM